MKSLARALFQRINRLYALGGNVSTGSRVHIGPGSRLWAPNRLTVGDDVYIGKRCTIEIDGVVGSGTIIANNVGIVGRRDHDMRQVGVVIRKARWVGHQENSDLSSTVILEGDNWVGYGATILGPVILGRGAVVAAGSVVTRRVPPYSIVAGNPAVVIGERFDEIGQSQHERELRTDQKVENP